MQTLLAPSEHVRIGYTTGHGFKIEWWVAVKGCTRGSKSNMHRRRRTGSPWTGQSPAEGGIFGATA
eukprot:1572298-Karenia_brevis.AAC.1